jgi:hypothetical protein
VATALMPARPTTIFQHNDCERGAPVSTGESPRPKKRSPHGSAQAEAIEQPCHRAAVPAATARGVSASRGKAMRAEPISLLYEKSRVLHRRGLDQLDAEMMAFSREWDRSVDGSPNRLDAMVWGLMRLPKVITHIPIGCALFRPAPRREPPPTSNTTCQCHDRQESASTSRDRTVAVARRAPETPTRPLRHRPAFLAPERKNHFDLIGGVRFEVNT